MSAHIGDNGYPLARDLTVRRVAVDTLQLLGRVTRKHSSLQIAKLASSILEDGFVLPILIDAQGRVVSGWGLVLAARKLELAEVPAIVVTDMTDQKLRSLRLRLNRLAEEASWDLKELNLEFSDLVELDAGFDLTDTGFDIGEIDFHLAGDPAEEEDEIPPIEAGVPVTQLGDIWICENAPGSHRVICGDALDPATYRLLLGEEKAECVFVDLPYNVEIDGHASGLGATKHAEFQMATGELSDTEFQEFLRKAVSRLVENSTDGSIHYLFMDWRHIHLLQAAAGPIYSELKNICIWNKSNAGMGSLYRSRHEMIAVYKNGKAPHINNIELGKNGRNRSNVWDYPSQGTLGPRKSKLALHPTAKPVALVADALRDCSNRRGIILDTFSGVGTTLIAAERTGRLARLIEIEGKYVDVAIRRWQAITGREAVHADSGKTFKAIAAERQAMIATAKQGKEIGS